MASRKTLTPDEVREIEKLIQTTRENPIDPETFIPWSTPMDGDYKFMPDSLFSLHGHKLYDTLSDLQKRELAKAEVGQAMYSYGWSEGLACLFFYRHLVTLKNNTSAEYRYLLIEIFEETCHQQMFSKSIETLGVQTVPPRALHRFSGWFATRLLPSDIVFMSVLAIEIVTDMYGRALMAQPGIFPMLGKIAELHKIEEDRHMYFAEILLKKYTQNAGLIRRTIYSLVVCFNIYFMRTLYVRKEILTRIGLDPAVYYQPAYAGLKRKFAENSLQKAIDFVAEWKGFNPLTRLFWRGLLSAKV